MKRSSKQLANAIAVILEQADGDTLAYDGKRYEINVHTDIEPRMVHFPERPADRVVQIETDEGESVYIGLFANEPLKEGG